jgi:hypothetical protein
MITILGSIIQVAQCGTKRETQQCFCCWKTYTGSLLAQPGSHQHSPKAQMNHQHTSSPPTWIESDSKDNVASIILCPCIPEWKSRAKVL